MPESTAKVIADSVSMEGYRITTMELYMPRYLLAELNTHRMIAKSAASSRAIPVQKRIDQVLNDPYIPAVFGENKPGMQAGDAIAGQDEARLAWVSAANYAAYHADHLNKLGVHKQQANRILEPFVYVPVVITFTESSNFFNLRHHEDADPGFYDVAKKMRKSFHASTPKVLDGTQWHTPYLTDADEELDYMSRLRVSAARCARVSYKTHDGLTPSRDNDLELAQTLFDSGHMSPFDHQALSADSGIFSAKSRLELEQAMRQFVGWVPYRVFMEHNAGIESRRFYKRR